MKITYEIPSVYSPKKKEAFLDSLTENFQKMSQWFLTVLEKVRVFVKLVYEEKTRNEPGISQGDHECGSEGERYKGSFSFSFWCPGDYITDLNASISNPEGCVRSYGASKELGAVP